MNKLFRFLVLATIISPFLFACSKQGIYGQQSDALSMLQPGEKIDDMVITTGAEDAPPLSAFCSPGQHSGNTIISDCSVPVLPTLGIGHILISGDDILTKLDWSEITWELTIDDQPIDLKSFGTYDFVLPAMSPSPSPVREVFVKFTAWDVVLTNLTPGEHTIRGRAQIEAESYNWVINLTIRATHAFDTSSSMARESRRLLPVRPLLITK